MLDLLIAGIGVGLLFFSDSDLGELIGGIIIIIVAAAFAWSLLGTGTV